MPNADRMKAANPDIEFDIRDGQTVRLTFEPKVGEYRAYLRKTRNAKWEAMGLGSGNPEPLKEHIIKVYGGAK